MPPGPTAPIRRRPGVPTRSRQQELERIDQELKDLGQAQAQAKGAPRPEIDRLKAQVELQQKQIDVLLRMTQLLADQVKKQPADRPRPSRSCRSRSRPRRPASSRAPGATRNWRRSRDDLVERLDAETRNDPPLPATLRELFSPTRNNESPLTIYGIGGSGRSTPSASRTAPSATRPSSSAPTCSSTSSWLMSANVALQIKARSSSGGRRPSGSSTTT